VFDEEKYEAMKDAAIEGIGENKKPMNALQLKHKEQRDILVKKVAEMTGNSINKMEKWLEANQIALKRSQIQRNLASGPLTQPI